MRTRSRRKKVPSRLGGMVLLLGHGYDGFGTNRRVATAQKDILRGYPMRVDSGQLGVPYVCSFCNRHKGPNLAGIDRASSRTKLVRLFNPRRHKWKYHFRWAGPRLVGKTPIGRVTVAVLAMNDPIRVALRQQLMNEGQWERKRAASGLQSRYGFVDAVSCIAGFPS